MAQQDQGTVPSESGSFPAKRKRGRPRKYDDTGYEPRKSSGAFPTHSEANQTAGIHVKLPQAKQPTSSSQDRHSLVGQPVSGVLSGTFDAGYLLTVRVGSTGEVLNGVVFDPCLCVPISEKNDIAPLLPVASPRGNLSSVAETPRSLNPAIRAPLTENEPASPFKSTNHELFSESQKVFSIDGKPVMKDACHSPVDVQANIFQVEIQEVISLDDKSQHPVVHDKESERPSTPVAVQESSEAAMATGKLTETLGVDGFLEQTVESSQINSSEGCQTENVIKALEDGKKHPAEDKSSGTFPGNHSSNETLELLDEPKFSGGEEAIPLSGLIHESSSQVNTNI